MELIWPLLMAEKRWVTGVMTPNGVRTPVNKWSYKWVIGAITAISGVLPVSTYNWALGDYDFPHLVEAQKPTSQILYLEDYPITWIRGFLGPW